MELCLYRQSPENKGTKTLHALKIINSIYRNIFNPISVRKVQRSSLCIHTHTLSYPISGLTKFTIIMKLQHSVKCLIPYYGGGQNKIITAIGLTTDYI